jgi:hypothetical protein
MLIKQELDGETPEPLEETADTNKEKYLLVCCGSRSLNI